VGGSGHKEPTKPCLLYPESGERCRPTLQQGERWQRTFEFPTGLLPAMQMVVFHVAGHHVTVAYQSCGNGNDKAGEVPIRGVRQCDRGGADDNSNSADAKSKSAVLSIASVYPSKQSMYPSFTQRMNPRASLTRLIVAVT
jgi:hypothetical protein